MIIALGVMLVTSLMCAAAFLAVESDARNVGRDLQAKQAYAAAQAGVQAYLYQLNENSETGWWEACANDTQAAQTVPGATTGVTYSWAPVTTCVSSDPVGSLIDGAGNLRIKFTGTAGTGASAVTRTIVASFTTSSPLSYLWYTVHETLDPAAEPACAGDPFFYNQVSSGVTIPFNCKSQWTGGDKINGPLYTQDQLNINPSSNPGPSFQNVTSDAPSTDPNAVCVASNCYNATFLSKQTVEGGGQAVPFPTDNSGLLADATAHGLALTGTVNVVLNGATATVAVCPTSTCTSVTTVSLSQKPIIYASNASGCNTTYDPSGDIYSFNSSKYAYGPCGDIYVSGSYSASLTLAAANDIVIAQNPTVSTTSIGVTAANDTTGQIAPTGTATLGLVANEYVRVYHPATFAANATECNGASAPNPNVTIDAAVLTLQHSFFVDNYTCGAYNPAGTTTSGTLTVHGSLAQEYRGSVATVSGTSLYGYVKNYNYDFRLATVLPPYMFDLESTQWTTVRETLCSPGSGTCSNT